MKNMIVSDYDETLYKNTRGLRANIEAIERFRNLGNIFVLSTARPYHSIKKEIDKYNIPYDYLSCSDGVQIFSGDNYIAAKRVYTDVINKVLDIIPLEPIFSYSKEEDKIIEMAYKVDGTYNEDEMLSTLKEELKEYKNINVFYEYIWDEKFIMIKRGDISKSTSARAIAIIEDIDFNRVFTIGDGLNDVPMIRDFNGYAISGATDEVLDVCLGSCETVSELIHNVSKNKVKVKMR